MNKKKKSAKKKVQSKFPSNTNDEVQAVEEENRGGALHADQLDHEMNHRLQDVARLHAALLHLVHKPVLPLTSPLSLFNTRTLFSTSLLSDSYSGWISRIARAKYR